MKPEKKYLSLFRGDDTAFNGGGGFDFVIETPEDTMDGFSIEFSFIGITKTITEFRRLGEKRFAFSVQFTAQETKNLPLCFQNATMVMLQTVDGIVLRKTITNKCLIHVTNNTVEAYDTEQGACHIQIQPGSISGTLIGIVLDLNASLEDRMNALSQIIIRGGGTVIPKSEDDNEDDGQ